MYNKKDSKEFYLRVLWGGQPMKTSTPMGTLDMIPVQTFLDCESVLLSYSGREVDVFDRYRFDGWEWK